MGGERNAPLPPAAAQDEQAGPPVAPEAQIPANLPADATPEPEVAPPPLVPAPQRPAASSSRRRTPVAVAPLPPQPEPRRSGRSRHPPGEWWKVSSTRPTPEPTPEPDDAETEEEQDDDEVEEESAARVHSGQSLPFPSTLSQALKRSDHKDWKAAADFQIKAHVDNGTWEPCPLPSGRKAIGCRWVLVVKYHADGTVERHKARLVAKGFSQRPGFDYIATFAPTVRMATIRTVLALAAIDDMCLRSIDISHAFINGVLDEEIYMQQPEGYHFGNPGDVLHLRKSLYGLKQAGRVWNQTLHHKLESFGFIRSKADSSFYIYTRGTTRIFVPIYIDDITISSSSEEESDRTVAELSTVFDLRDLGPTTSLLGMEIIRDRSQRKLSLSHRQYILDMLEKYDFSSCSPAHTPMQPGLHLTTDMCPKSIAEEAEMSKVPAI